MNGRFVRSFYHVPIRISCTSRFECEGPIVGRSSVIVTISRSKRATSALTTIRLTHEGKTFMCKVYGTINSSVTETASSKACVRIKPRVNITSAGTFAKRMAILLLLTLAVNHRGKAISRGGYESVTRRLLVLPRALRSALSLMASSMRSLTRVFACTRGFVCVKHKIGCPATLRNTLGLGRVSCVRTRNCPTTRVGRKPVTLVSTRVPYIIVTAPSSACSGAIDGIRRVGTENNEVITVITRRSIAMSRVTSCIVGIPSTSRFLVPIVISVPLRLLTCRVTIGGNESISGPHGLTGSIAIR